MVTSGLTITNLEVAADHPAYLGHFPGAPVLPGVVLLDAALHVLLGESAPHETVEDFAPCSLRWQIATAKFHSAVRPGEPLTLQHETLPNGSIRFTIQTADRPVANGLLVPPPLSGRDRGEQG